MQLGGDREVPLVVYRMHEAQVFEENGPFDGTVAQSNEKSTDQRNGIFHLLCHTNKCFKM